MGWLVPRSDLTEEQIRAVELRFDRHQVVCGSPGSGKTIIMLHRARHLVDNHGIPMEGFKVMVFTNVLKSYIMNGLQDLQLPDESVSTFDAWCVDYYRDNINRRLPWSGRTYDFKAIRSRVWDITYSNSDFTPIYDFVLVDEAQDLDIVAFQILKAIAKHVTAFLDPKQQIYDSGGGESTILNTLGVRKRSLNLLSAYRCSPYIVRVAASFISDPLESKRFICQNLSDESGERQMPLLYIARNKDDELENLIQIVRDRIDRNDRIVILFPQRRQVNRFANSFREAGLEVEIPARHGRITDDRLEVDFATARPKLMAYPSVKGLTCDTVFMPTMCRSLFKNVSAERLRRLLFVGTSRATRWIYFSTTDQEILVDGDLGNTFDGLEKSGQLKIIKNPQSHTQSPPADSESNDDVFDII